MSPVLDVENWPNREQVAAQLGISGRQVDRLGLDHRNRQREGMRAERVYNPEQVAARLPPPITSVVKTQTPIETVQPSMSEMSELPPITWPAIIQLVETIAQGMQPQEPTTYCRLEEASRITGLTVSYLRRLVKAKRLVSVKDVAIKVKRESLATLDASKPAPAKKRKPRKS